MILIATSGNRVLVKDNDLPDVPVMSCDRLQFSAVNYLLEFGVSEHHMNGFCHLGIYDGQPVVAMNVSIASDDFLAGSQAFSEIFDGATRLRMLMSLWSMGVPNFVALQSSKKVAVIVDFGE